jgi:hypothetical protein
LKTYLTGGLTCVGKLTDGVDIKHYYDYNSHYPAIMANQ